MTMLVLMAPKPTNVKIMSKKVEGKPREVVIGMRSKTPLEGYSVFLYYESSTCKTEIKHPRVPFSNAFQTVFIRKRRLARCLI